MATESANQPFAAQQVLQAQENANKIIEQLSTEELRSPSCCVSARLGRSFIGRTEFEGIKALDAAIEEAQRALPEAPSAYKPTGKTTVAATLLMLLAAPVVLALLLAICGGICWGFVSLLAYASPDQSYSQSRLLGVLSLFLDLVLVILMVVIPMGCFGALSKWFKNRNPTIPAILTGAIDLLVAVVLFVPIWKGETLAPTHLTFLFIPIRWVLIVVGGLIVPLVGAAVVHGQVAGQKFCEETGRYLRRMRRVRIPFDFGENALALLRRGEYVLAGRLPSVGEKETKQKHWAEITLWWQEQATTAFLELEMRFHRKSKPQKKLTTEESKEKSKDWRTFSVQLNRAQAESLADALRGP